MNNSVQAQKGFKTFLLTLSISLIVFSVIYYVITTTSTNTAMDLSPNVESDSPTAMNVTQNTNDSSGEVAGASSDRSNENVSTTPTTFGALASQKMDVPPQRQVLGGATQATQSTTTVPNGGSFEITMGLLMSTLAFVVGTTLVAKDPRKMALNGFERDLIREL